MRKLISIVSFLVATSVAMAQGAHDFKINEVYVYGCGSCCHADSGAVAEKEHCEKPASYVDEYGQQASWIEIENTS